MGTQNNEGNPSFGRASIGSPLLDLPLEIQLRIMQDAAPPTIVSFINYRDNARALRGTACQMGQIHKQLGDVAKLTHSCILTDWTLQALQMNPITDTFLYRRLKFPFIDIKYPRSDNANIKYTNADNMKAFPVRPTTALPSLTTPTIPGAQIKAISDPGKSDAGQPISEYPELPFWKLACVIRDMDECMLNRFGDTATMPLPKLLLGRFRHLREYTLMAETTNGSWLIPGCQIYEPQVVDRRDNGNTFNWIEECSPERHPRVTEAEEYFTQRGIAGDTGLGWPLNEDVNRAAPILAIKSWSTRRQAPVPTLGRIMPRIGLMGYSANATSIGGQWAGFRYYVDTGRVEFTPLAYHEVQELLEAGRKSQGVLPDMVVRVWVIRPGEEGIAPDESYHGWEEVQPYSETEDERTCKIRGLWQRTRTMFEGSPVYTCQ
ncbi:hypothetical protein BGZ61DRAFT_527139 [Ilyonectria robusta]|uniref:uncharacterized protein n=1 Tax=Ilyonectria robusta TaxID=1079257 RepID=UPI001E8E050A|nr:uncharacterized protein BGZ61DRAFT_527139 [Ilyonectria robusta]KAH8736151.1 hypothetical protein BGZ61DRAFT_527139 [Ilyonectria robusta]